MIASGILEQHNLAPLGFFELTRFTMAGTLLGLAYVTLFYKKLLPDRRQNLDQTIVQQNEHCVRFVVSEKSSIIG